MRLRLSNPSTGVLVIGLALAIVAGATVGSFSPDYRIVLPIAFAVVSAFAVYWCVKVRPLRWMDPLVWMILPLALEFVARPLANLAAGHSTYRDYYVLPYYVEVSAIGLAGLLALCAGYAARTPARLGRAIPPLPEECDDDRIGTLTSRLIGLALLLYGAFAVKTGLSPRTLINAGLPVTTSNGGITAYLGLAPWLAVPISLLLLHRGLNGHNWYLIGTSVGLALLVGFVFGAAGNRFGTLLFGSLILYVVLRYRWRPPLWQVVTGLCCALIFVAAAADFKSNAANPSLSSSVEHAIVHPVKSIELIVLGPTLEEFDGMAVEVQLVPSDLGFHPFTSITSVLAQPIPRSLWPGKPYHPEGYLDVAAFGAQGVSSAGSASVLFTTMGGFYYDSGVIGVIVGMAFVGALLRVISEYVTAHRSNALVLLTLSAILPLVVVLSRGNLADTLSRSLFVVVPIPVIAFLARKRPQYAITKTGPGVSNVSP
jgi:hypothetical protein